MNGAVGAVRLPEQMYGKSIIVHAARGLSRGARSRARVPGRAGGGTPEAWAAAASRPSRRSICARNAIAPDFSRPEGRGQWGESTNPEAGRGELIPTGWPLSPLTIQARRATRRVKPRTSASIVD